MLIKGLWVRIPLSPLIIKIKSYDAKSKRVHYNGLTREERRRKKYSESFNEIFTFFLRSYRYKILDFCGSEVNTIFDINSQDCKFCFKSYDNGIYSKEEISKGIKSKHSNILKGVIIGKKSWGLWKNEWSKGISEGLFTLNEILEEFNKFNIKIPDSLMKDFENSIHKMKYNY